MVSCKSNHLFPCLATGHIPDTSKGDEVGDWREKLDLLNNIYARLIHFNPSRTGDVEKHVLELGLGVE